MARRVDLTGVRRSGLNDYGGAGVSGGDQQSLSNSSQINFDQIKVEKGGGRQPINSGSVSKAKFSVRRNIHPGMAHIVSRSGQQARPGEKPQISDS